jgi:nucleotide-binding universal stress UspA family protein
MSVLSTVPDKKQNDLKPAGQKSEVRAAFKHVLFATDFSAASERALTYAIAITRRYSSELSIAHAIPPDLRDPIPLEPLPRKLNRRWLEAQAQMQHVSEKTALHDLNRCLLLEQGPVWEILAALIQRQAIDLLVLGTRGRGGLKKLALGSVAEEVLRLAPCPVLTIGPHVPPATPGASEFNRILFATDFGPAAAKAFPYALSLAEDHHAQLVLLHLVSPLPAPDLAPAAYGPANYGAEEFIRWQATMREQSRKKLMALLPPDARLAAEPEYVVASDFLPEGILDTATSHKIELIVMGANRTSSPRATSHMPWALIHEVICHASCPVLTVSD